MGWLTGTLTTIAVAAWVAYFWCRVGWWLYLHGRTSWRKAERFRDAVIGVYRNDA